MGLDNGIYVKSNKRKLTRDMLPSSIVFPFEQDYSDGIEILYWRKNWGLRNAVIKAFQWKDDPSFSMLIETPRQIVTLIEVIASFLDKDKWELEGDSIWDYEEERPTLIQNIVNLAQMIGFMEHNPDVYLKFYDSY